jgi:hypothetical protein
VTIDIDLTEQEYHLLEGNFQRGLHHGQAASPHIMTKKLRELGVERYVFRLDDVGQFDASFSVWVHEDDWALMQAARDEWLGANKDSAISPAHACEAALRGMGAQR